MRKFIRHPSDIPIEVEVDTTIPQDENQHLVDVSIGGLCFASSIEVTVNSFINVRIDVVNPPFRAKGRVAWCRHHGSYYDVGVELLGRQQAYQARMVEQVCHIEHYRQHVLEIEGRELTSEEAAGEWISRFAANFPNWAVGGN